MAAPRLLAPLLASLALAPAAAAQTVVYDVPGTPTASYFGYALELVPDVTGDGTADFLVSSWSGFGRVQLRSGSDGAKVWEIAGVFEQHYGESLAFIGDSNGDGKPDVLIGAPTFNAEFPIQTNSADVRTAATGALLQHFVAGLKPQYSYGRSVAGIGDVNLDGLPDFAIGSPAKDSVEVRAGGTWQVLYTATSPPGFSYGWSVAGAGDTNADGIRDVIAGGPYLTGIVRVLSGNNGGILREFTTGLGTDGFGTCVEGVGDVDGDANDDYLIGAPGFFVTSPGFVRLVSGASGTPIHVWFGTPGQNLGSALTRMGDVDFDLVPDFAMSQGGTLSGPYDQGTSVFVVSGATFATFATMTGNPLFYGFGNAIRGGADLDGDVRPDLLIGSKFETVGASSNVGIVRLFSLTPGLSSYGAGLAGCSGPHHMNGNGTPAVGNASFGFRCDRAPASSLGLCLVTDLQDPVGSDPLGIQVPLLVGFAGAGEVYGLDMPSTAAGYGFAPAPIPASPFLAGHHYYAQALWLWPAIVCSPSPLGLSASNGLSVTIQ